MPTIPLSQGQFALVDDDDYQSLNQFKWYAVWAKNSQFYARRREVDSGKEISMQNAVLPPRLGLIVDHRKRTETLDNRKGNLRYATNSQNQANKRVQSNNKTGYKGICWNKRRSRWRVQVWLGGKAVYEKSFVSLQDAIEAHSREATRIYGEFALLNV
jgi:hypothetical protein